MNSIVVIEVLYDKYYCNGHIFEKTTMQDHESAWRNSQ